MTEKKRLDYFEHERIICMYFGSALTESYFYDLRNERIKLHIDEPTACLYKSNPRSYDNYKFISFGDIAEDVVRHSDRSKVFYIDKLRDKVEYLYSVEPDIKKSLKQAKDRLYQRAIIQYFKELIKKIVRNDNRIELSKNRYVITYPSHWNLEQAEYLRFMVQMTGIVNKYDHPDRLIMFSEGDAIFYRIQEPFSFNEEIKEGHKYMICDLSGTKVEMHLYDVKGSISPQSEIKNVTRCNWYNSNIKKPAQPYIGEEDFYPETELYLSSLFSTSSVTITVKDLENILSKGKIEGCRTLEDWWEDMNQSVISEWFTKEDFEINTPIRIEVHPLLQDLYFERLINLRESDLSSSPALPRWITDGHVNLYPREIKKRVYKSVCYRIVQYMKDIIENMPDTSIDAVILVGSVRRNPYLMELIAKKFKEVTKRKILHRSEKKESALYGYNIAQGAMKKCLDNIIADAIKPKIVLDDFNLSPYPRLVKNQNVMVLIDFGLDKTRVSYVHNQPGQIADGTNIEHIMDWPGQAVVDRNFLTLNAILTPMQPSNVEKDSNIISWWKLNLFSSCLPRNRSKKKVDLQEKAGYDNQSTAHSHAEYYTFEKDKYGIILVTHKKSGAKKRSCSNFGNFQSKTTANSTFSSYQKRNTHDDIVSQKRITFQEFSMLYFQCLIDFLGTYIYSKTGMRKDKYRYCITHDSQQFTEEFTLSNSDIKHIAHKCEMVQSNNSNSLLILERSEASAIYCRKKIDTNIISDKETHIYFLQVQLYSDRCVLILNGVPLFDDNDKKLWESVHKYAKIKNVAIDVMDIICEELWIYIQKNQCLLLKKCEKHHPQRSFFNSRNMKIFKKMFHTYISTTKTLDLEDCEKSHSIHTCDNVQGSCCCVSIKNTDLLEYAIKPAINQLVAIVQSSVSNQTIFQGIQINDMFVMGKFLLSKDLTSYKLLEDILLAKLRKINFPKLENHILQSMSKKVQITKLIGREYEQGQTGYDIENAHDSLAQVSSIGSAIFGIDPRNRLIERLADRTYVVKLYHDWDTKFFFDHPGRTTNGREKFHTIMLKGTPLNSFSSIENEIINSFTVPKIEGKNFVYIDLLASEEDDISFLNDENMDGDSWKEKFSNSNFELLKHNSFSKYDFPNPSYPFVFKTHHSQTELYKLRVEHGKNEKEEAVYIREPILLKSCHNDK